MKKIIKLFTNIGLSLILICSLFTISTILVNYSLKGKPIYLKSKENKSSLDIDYVFKNYIDNYEVEIKNNTMYVTMESELTKEENIGLFVKLFMLKDKNDYDIQIVSQSLLDDSILWASITDNGVSIA